VGNRESLKHAALPEDPARGDSRRSRTSAPEAFEPDIGLCSQTEQCVIDVEWGQGQALPSGDKDMWSWPRAEMDRYGP
jgi:hypothetical protein